LTARRILSIIAISIFDKKGRAVKQAQRRRDAWLARIRVLLLLMLLADLVSIPLNLFGHGAPHVGSVSVGDVFGGQAYVDRRFPMLDLNDVSVVALQPSLAQDLLYSLGSGLAFMLASIPMLGYAIRVIDEARAGDPFTPAMVRRLRKLGLLVLVLGLLSGVVEYTAQAVLLAISLPDDQSLRFGAAIDHYPSLWWLLPGLVLLAVSEVVKRGCDLRAELDGVI
jgi:hypothetical protein